VGTANKRQISILMENRDLFPFFKLEMKPRRQYPEGSLAAHLLGYVGEVTDEDLKWAQNLHPGDIIGRTGIEYRYEGFLKGQDGIRVVEISAEGIRIGEIENLIDARDGAEFVSSQPPVPGNDVYLTIDLELQHAVERIFGWERGSVVMMDPRNGEIIAAVSRPTYDPNIFLLGVSERQWSRLNNDPAKPLFNRTVQATYPPGSIFKLITAYAGLQEGVIRRGQRFVPCLGAYKFGNRYFGCWKPEGHGALSLFGAIVESCDVYFYQVGELLTADQFAAAGRLFGFGKVSGIDLPGEVTGNCPNHAYFDRRYGKRKWTKGHLLNYSIGQGELLATPMQLCIMTAVFANGGRMVRPHVVMKIVNADGKIVYRPGGTPGAIQGIDRRDVSIIRNAMESVVSGESGTGRAAALADFRIAGKTGTSQNPHGEDHALFVAYAPVEAPEVVLTIVMENAGHGGAMAAPLAREILAEYFSTVAGLEGEYQYGVLDVGRVTGADR
jgi:penicillin-binding protein 2